MTQKAAPEKKKKKIPTLVEKGQEMGKTLLRKKCLEKKLLRGQLENAYFSLQFRDK